MFRRQALVTGTLWAAAVILAMVGSAHSDGAPLAPYPQTREVLAELVASGQAALAHYHQSERQARFEDKPYIADLFKAVATSQAVMNRNFRELLTDLGGEINFCAETRLKPATTRQNLIVAIRQEIRQTDKLYPQALARIVREGHGEAIGLLEQALRAQQLRRGDMREIHMGARYFYSRLQKEVRRRATIYYVCQQSGALLINDLPAVCPVRGAATTSYRPLQRIVPEVNLQACKPSPHTRQL